MFDVIVMPLADLWDEGQGDLSKRSEGLERVQQVLSEQTGTRVSWADIRHEGDGYDLDELEAYALYALKALASFHEAHGTIDGFNVGDEPWDHEALTRLDHGDVSKRYPQLLHADADVMAYVPVALADVYYMGEDDMMDDEACSCALGSALALVEELRVLADVLSMNEDLDGLSDDHVFDESEDPLAAPRYAWALLSARVKEACGQGTSLLLVVSEGADGAD